MGVRKPGMLVTPATLRRAGACRGYITKFRKRFPKRVRVTQRLCEQHAQTWRWDWAGANLLNESGKLEFLRAKTLIDKTRRQTPFLQPVLEGVSLRAYNVALASLFGGLAEQKKYDPAHTP